jgi:hypothetical protein
MRKLFLAGVLTAAGSGLACSIIPYEYHYDTLAAGEVLVWRHTAMQGTLQPTDTLGIFRARDFQSHLYQARKDSPLIFIGALDSVVLNDTSTASASYKVLKNRPYDSAGTWVSLKLRVDTLIQGTLPSRSFWMKARFALTTCGISYGSFIGRAFLNISHGLDSVPDLKVPSLYAGSNGAPPAAHWFDGRYVVSPKFPGLKVELFDSFDNGPTGILRLKDPVKSFVPAGRAYQPDGRRVKSTKTGRKIAAPLLK